MSGFFEEFGTYDNFRSGQFSQELTQGAGSVTLGNSQNINVIERAEQDAHRQIDVLAQAARNAPRVSTSRSSNASSTTTTTATSATPATTAPTPAPTMATQVVASTPAIPGATTVVTTTTVAEPAQTAVTTVNVDEPFLPEGTDEESAEIARLLQAERDAEAAKQASEQQTSSNEEDDEEKEEKSFWDHIIDFFW